MMRKLVVLVFAACLALNDIIWRFDEIVHLGLGDLGFFALTLASRLLILYILLAGLSKIKSLALKYSLILTLTTALSTVFVVTYRFHAQFKSLPSTYTFQYMLIEPKDSLHLFLSSLTPQISLVIIGLSLCLSLVALEFQKIFSQDFFTRKRMATAVFVQIGMVFVFHNNVRNFPGSSVFESNFAYGLSYAINTQIRGQSVIRGLGDGMHASVESLGVPIPFNVLLIVNESLRAKSSFLFNEEMDAKSEVRKILLDGHSELIRFPKAYSNSTATVTSFPGILSGINPSLPPGLLHTAPLIFDFAKAYEGVSTFLISSQSYEWGRFRNFLESSDIDHLWYLENSGLKVAPGLFLDDERTVDQMISHLQSLKREQTSFVGAVQFFDTHSPYTIEEDDPSITSKDPFDYLHYVSAIRKLDKSTARLLRYMKDNNLWDNTLILSTSDHGEGFGEHGYYSHTRTFFDEEAKIPVWIKLPKDFPETMRKNLLRNSHAVISNDDWIPTLVSSLRRSAKVSQDYAPKRFHWLGNDLSDTIPKDRVVVMKSNRLRKSGEKFMSLGLIYKDVKFLHWEGEKEPWTCIDTRKDPYELQPDCEDIEPSVYASIQDYLLKGVDFPLLPDQKHRTDMPVSTAIR